MAKTPGRPKKPGKSQRTKAGRPDVLPIGPVLAELLNPAINRGDAGTGSGTGLQPPPDNSWDRRSGGEAAAHRARASTRGKSDDVAKKDALGSEPGSLAQASSLQEPSRQEAKPEGFDEAPQAHYGTSATVPMLDPELARHARRAARGECGGGPRPPAAKQEGAARQQGDRRCTGDADPRGPSGIPQGRRHHEGVDAAPAAAPGKIRRRRALRDQVRLSA